LPLENRKTLLNVQNLTVCFNNTKAVDEVSFGIAPGQVLGLVGESGCGKTTLARTILLLQPPTSGRIEYQGQNIFDPLRATQKRLRREIQIVFQDPMSSLNPRMTVGSIVTEPLKVHRIGSPSHHRDSAISMLKRVGLESEIMHRYPHELSGGQRQRVGIARALILQPRLVICDEVVSALDVSVQAQIIKLLIDLKHQLALSYLFISHNLAVVEQISDEVVIMLEGRIVEKADVHRIYHNPQHPYTKSLLTAAPVPDPRHRRR